MGSDDFVKKFGCWIWVGHDWMNARIYLYTKLCAAVGAKYGADMP